MSASTLTRGDISPVIADYMDAHVERNSELGVPLFWSDATVTDEAATHSGTDAIRLWMNSAAAEYTYTTTESGYEMVSADHVQVFVRLEGNFPGGVADVVFDFQLRDGKIASLVID